jgi:CRISPR-associated protein Cst2
MQINIHIAYVTKFNTFANNRGDNEGSNIAPLQKVIIGGRQFTTNSPETIKFALRRILCRLYGDEEVNRTYEETNGGNPKHLFKSAGDPEKYLDDDLFGFMKTEAKKEVEVDDEGDDDTPKKGKKKTKSVKGTCDTRTGRWGFSRAISLDSYKGDMLFNVRGRTESDANPMPYQSESHSTRYQFGCTLTPNALEKPARAHQALKALVQLSGVGGNQANSMTDYSPETIIFRLTPSIPHGMLGVFQMPNEDEIRVPKLIDAIKCGDIDPKEILIGGLLTEEDAKTLSDLGVEIHRGIKASLAAFQNRLIKAGVEE